MVKVFVVAFLHIAMVRLCPVGGGMIGFYPVAQLLRSHAFRMSSEDLSNEFKKAQASALFDEVAQPPNVRGRSVMDFAPPSLKVL
jgi:hypothetical protein